jgi:formylglycine-generating enzyme required for sulfatase activity
MRIGRSYALGACSVTVEQYRRFDTGYKPRSEYDRLTGLPVVFVSWQEAAAYCNWLSRMEGIPPDDWCYETDPKDADPNVKGVKLRANYLSLAGYRLPTEAEIEYSTRAGALTSRYYGETDELLPDYAWYVKNARDKTWPVGTKKPNDFGFFDLLGNTSTWCQESSRPYPSGAKVYNDEEGDLTIVSTAERIIRGGTFSDNAKDVRSANRGRIPAIAHHNSFGFRVAKTLARTSVDGVKPKH